jgi:hypothetical protein
MSRGNRQYYGWILAAVLALILLLLWRGFGGNNGDGIENAVSHPSMTGLNPSSQTALRASQGDFLGHWTGKRDETWGVRVTISEDAGGGLAVLYEWEESIGRPFQRMRVSGTLKGDVLHVGDLIELIIEPGDPNRAIAFGKFARQRKSVLIRQ